MKISWFRRWRNDSVPENFPQEILREHQAKLDDSLTDSLKEDIEDARLDPTEAKKMSHDHIRALATARRGDENIEKLSTARDLLLSFWEVVGNTAPIEWEENRARVKLFASDIGAIWWGRCKCGHFYLHHRFLGGCTKKSIQRCSCAERGHMDLPLAELEKLR